MSCLGTWTTCGFVTNEHCYILVVILAQHRLSVRLTSAWAMT